MNQLHKRYYGLILAFLVIAFAKAQDPSPTDSTETIVRKEYRATRVTDEPIIDGRPFEEFWKDIPEATDFVMLNPDNGQPMDSAYRTSVKIAYNDRALYVAGYMRDPEPERILRQFSQRDQVDVQADLFGFYLNTYNNQINQTRFFATSANALGDAAAERGSEDFSFNVVFTSEASIDENGWYVEMEIPYRTLRFVDAPVQDWSFNVLRRIRHLNQEFTYNFVDISKGNSAQYDALLTGIENIDPPLRLNLYPYGTSFYDTAINDSKINFAAGMDLKWGINETFTLDATLIPDFSQVAFDPVALNLGPFEQVFNENRQFFIEGIELFETGDIFFSRRIGQRRTSIGEARSDLIDDEEILENPDQAKLLNAIKLTGRTSGNLGIGVLNAITDRTETVIRNNRTGERRVVETQPLVNYNVLVLDQQYGNGSSISLTNASTLRDGSFTDANVSALTLNHLSSDLNYRFFGRVQNSIRFKQEETESGFATDARFSKISGNWRYTLGHSFANDTYDPNDLGLQFRNNYNNFRGDLSYVQFEPVGIFNRYDIALRTRYRRVADPSVHRETVINLNPFFFTRERLAFGGDLTYSFKNLNQFESRIRDVFIVYGDRLNHSAFISTDYRKKFAIDARYSYDKLMQSDEMGYSYTISPRFRFSDKFLVVYDFNWSKREDRMSWVEKIEDEDRSIFASRDDHEIENTISGTYNFNNRQAVSISFRNNWSRADFASDYFILEKTGYVEPTNETPSSEPDTDFNIWNLDLSYRWRFAAGSEATLLYRNSIFNSEDNAGQNYFNSTEDLFQQDLGHLISLRIVYFLDFNRVIDVFES